MIVGAPLVEAEQDRSVCIEDLCEVVMGRNGSRLTEQRLVPLEAAWHIGGPNDRPRALQWLPLLRPSSLPATSAGRPNEVYKHFPEIAVYGGWWSVPSRHCAWSTTQGGASLRPAAKSQTAVGAAMTASATARSQMATAVAPGSGWPSTRS